jgi:hypothetical protein
MSASESLRIQWLSAAKSLGIDALGPVHITAADGKSYEFSVLLPQFGPEQGMLLNPTYDQGACVAATKLGYGFSILDPAPGQTDSAELDGYIDCLVDWGWSEVSSPPRWYTRAKKDP